MQLPQRLKFEFPSVRSPYPEVQRFRERAVVALLVFAFLVVPAMNLAGVIEPHDLNRIGRYLCFAIAALGSI